MSIPTLKKKKNHRPCKFSNFQPGRMHHLVPHDNRHPLPTMQRELAHTSPGLASVSSETRRPAAGSGQSARRAERSSGNRRRDKLGTDKFLQKRRRRRHRFSLRLLNLINQTAAARSCRPSACISVAVRLSVRRLHVSPPRQEAEMNV